MVSNNIAVYNHVCEIWLSFEIFRNCSNARFLHHNTKNINLLGWFLIWTKCWESQMSKKYLRLTLKYISEALWWVISVYNISLYTKTLNQSIEKNPVARTRKSYLVGLLAIAVFSHQIEDLTIQIAFNLSKHPSQWIPSEFERILPVWDRQLAILTQIRSDLA